MYSRLVVTTILRKVRLKVIGCHKDTQKSFILIGTAQNVNQCLRLLSVACFIQTHNLIMTELHSLNNI